MSLVMCLLLSFFLFKQKTAYEMRISDWSSDVCSSDLFVLHLDRAVDEQRMVFDRNRLRKPDAILRMNARHRAGERLQHCLACRFQPVDAQVHRCPTVQYLAVEIGRASCRERVCRYV